MTRVRTRFAPSPTGFIHLGNIRSALYPWAFARHSGGDFILRIEDTDTERSSQASVDAILQGMRWLGLDFDEGPFYQTQRMSRYKEVLEQLLARGLAYPCYTTTQELDALREQQMAAQQKPRYDGRWRPEPGKTLPPIPAGVTPAIRFKTPSSGRVTWQDKVKGQVAFDNQELDDLVIARSDGVPTYNFCVVVDDMDMNITHVIRGDDHVNNTPRQIHIFAALGYPVPVFAHLPTVLNEHGEKMSKRHGALSVMAYRELGFLPDALVNYLARMGWSHGNDEIISRAQLIEWFDLQHLGSSAAQFNQDKLLWLNAHYLRQMPAPELAHALRDWHRSLADTDLRLGDAPKLDAVVELLKDRAQTLRELAEQAQMFYAPTPVSAEQWQTVASASVLAALADLRTELAQKQNDWQRSTLHEVLKACLQKHQLKMPQLAMPLRLLLTGRTQTPSIDAVLALVGYDAALARLTALPVSLPA